MGFTDHILRHYAKFMHIDASFTCHERRSASEISLLLLNFFEECLNPQDNSWVLYRGSLCLMHLIMTSKVTSILVFLTHRLLIDVVSRWFGTFHTDSIPNLYVLDTLEARTCKTMPEGNIRFKLFSAA